MAYTCDLGSGQTLWLDQRGEQTTVTLASGRAGQQQQSSSQFTTGTWTAAPEILRTGQGVVVKLTTTQGTHHLQVNGTQVGMVSAGAHGHVQQTQTSSQTPATAATMPPMEPLSPMSPMEPMPPMPPMPPMKMGNMEMNMNPMQMRMGNMEMKMDEPLTSAPTAKFCSQCGTPVQPSDRFCANCGHQLQR